MTQGDLFQTAISSQQDTHASLLVLPGSAEAQKMTAISGRTFLPLLKPNDPLFAFLKMFMVTLPWASTKCYLTWKVKATQQGRLLFQLAQSMPLTNEIDSGSSVEMWPTPKAQEPGRTTVGYGRGLKELIEGKEQMWPTPTVGCVEGGEQSSRVEKTNSGGYILRKKNKPHMTYGAKLSDAILFEEKQKMWPTPTANEDAAGTPKGKMQKMLGNHPEVRGKTPEEWQKGSLNPEWVTWLMGYPKGWTDLDCDTPKPHAGFEKEPEDIPRVASKIKDKTNRLRGLGNAIVPQIAMKIGLAIKLNAADRSYDL